MAKRKKPRKPEKELTPITVFAFAVVLGLAGYLAGEILFNNQVHPLHWLGGLVGIAIGYVIGWWVFRRYGDILGF